MIDMSFPAAALKGKAAGFIYRNSLNPDSRATRTAMMLAG
jgi:hypothetical protein